MRMLASNLRRAELLLKTAENRNTNSRFGPSATKFASQLRQRDQPHLRIFQLASFLFFFFSLHHR
jgi:hypothetical protein